MLDSKVFICGQKITELLYSLEVHHVFTDSGLEDFSGSALGLHLTVSGVKCAFKCIVKMS